MNNPKKQQSDDEYDIEGTDGFDQSNGVDDSSSVGSLSLGAVTSEASRGFGSSDLGITERLTDLLVGDGDGDLVIQRTNQENTVLQWLQALDLQVVGACRADERLKPQLKLNVCGGMAEDLLLSHLSRHFEPSEVGMLARCLCIPLLSVRVGKIKKRGTLLYPTSTRGNLTLTLLPTTSDLRISFIGDDGQMERLYTSSSVSDCSSLIIEEIQEDKSGRSFLIRVQEGEPIYFWCSEKSKLLGNELLEKMKSLLDRKPSLAELTGISESRLEYFATHLRSYLVGCQATTSFAKSPSSATAFSDFPQVCPSVPLPSLSSKPQRSRHAATQGTKPNLPHQCSLSPRPSSFKEGAPRNLSCLRNKFRRLGDTNLASIDDDFSFSSANGDVVFSNHSEEASLPESSGTFVIPPLDGIESPVKSLSFPFLSTLNQIPRYGSSFLSPYYCWCPPSASTVQYTSAPPQLLTSEKDSFSLPLPPLSSLLPASTTLLSPKQPLYLPEIASLDFPPFFPEPLVRLPTSQQIPTFTPLMCDPIVHIPVIDICSSGPSYLVSAGPAISATIPPLIQTAESMVEKSARETLRLLIGGSSQVDSLLSGVLPTVLSKGEEKKSILVTGSRGLYVGAADVSAMTDGIAAIFSESSDNGPAKGDDIKKEDVHCSGTCSEIEDLGSNYGGLEK